MKLLFILSFTFCCLGTQAQSDKKINGSSCRKAEQCFEVQVKPEQGGAFVLQLDNPEGKKISLQISHAELGVAIDTVIQSTSYGCRYRFDFADDGKYTIRLSSGRQVVTKELRLQSKTETSRLLEVK